MLKLLLLDVYLIVVSKPLNIPGWGVGRGVTSYINVHLCLKCISLLPVNLGKSPGEGGGGGKLELNT